MMQKSASRWSVNREDRRDAYSIGEFKADVLLLARSSLRNETFDTALDVSGKVFPAGLDMLSTRMSAGFIAQDAWFGAFSSFDAATFASLDVSRSQFQNTGFVASHVEGPAVFRGAKLDRYISFTTRFDGPVDFAEVEFLADAHFEGVYFKETPEFCSAVFHENVYFNDATFEGSADFSDAVFHKSVFLGGGHDRRVLQAIEAAEHKR